MTNRVTPVGIAGFNALREARGFKGAEENKKYSIELFLSAKEGMALVDELQVEANKLHAKELESAKARGKNVRYAPPIINYTETEDGRVRLTFKRAEVAGMPGVIDEDRQKYTGYVRRDAPVKVAFRLKPYVMANVFGVTLELLAVQVMGADSVAMDPSTLFGAAPAKPKAPKETPVTDLF